MIFSCTTGGIVIILARSKTLNSRRLLCARGFVAHGFDIMEVPDFRITTQLFMFFGCVTDGSGTVANFASAASWLPVNFDQFLIIADVCTNQATFQGNSFRD